MKQLLLLLLATILVANSVYAADKYDTVVYVDGQNQNITFVQDQPVVITNAAKPVAVEFRKSDEGIVTIGFCDYTPPTTFVRCRRVPIVPETEYYVSISHHLSVQIKR